MQRINKVIPTVLTEIKAPSTKERHIFTPNPRQVFEFDTCNDPQLWALLDAANAYALGLADEDAEPYWLSMLGSSGAGKSHLAGQLYTLARSLDFHCHHPTLINGVRFVFWPDVVDKLRDKKYHIIRDLTDANVLFLEDPAAERDPSGFAADSLYRVLEGRRRKWTVLTSNATPQEIAERLDTRIMSRLRRGQNKVVIADVLDYNLRTGREFFEECLLRNPSDRKRIPLLARFGINEAFYQPDGHWVIRGKRKFVPLPDELWAKLQAN